MTLHYHDVEQGSDDWLKLRCGMITASEIKLLMTPTGKVANNDKSRAHLYELAAQRISQHVEPHYISDDMLRGMHNESIAREYYESQYGPVTERGFYVLERDGVRIGYSPDGETFDGGLIEIKDRRQHHHVRVILDDAAPEEHMLQMQTGLLVTGKPYIDYVQQCLGLPLFVKRVYPDEVMQAAIWDACVAAEEKIQEMVARFESITAGWIQTERPEDEQEVYLGYRARVVDFETSGFEPPVAEVCEVGYCDVIIEDKHVCDPVSYLCGISGPMPPEVRAVHHIGAEDCEGSPPFDPDTLDLDDKVTVFAAHNWEFENRFFQPTKPAICTYKAALRVWPDAPSHSNGALFYWLLDQGLIEPDLSKSQPFHRAGPDAYATAWILVALLNSGATGKNMVAWTKEPRLLPKCTIGKFRGKPWSEVEDGFLGWMLKQVDMDADLKWNAARELKRRTE